MSSEENARAAAQISVLGGCLIEGDSEQKARERITKRSALTISILLQSVALVAIVMVPLLGHTEKISYRGAIPMPPYRPLPNKPITEHKPVQPPQKPTGFFQPTNIPPTISLRDKPIENPGQNGADAPDWNSSVPVPGTEGGTEFFTGKSGPKPPEDTNRNQTIRISKGGDVQQAMLLHRVEPCYPPLARQLRRSGQLRLRAVISTDGTVESLQLMDGDPLFVQCAMDAVRQWRYRPTTLNGSPVEVETVITVVYTLNQ
ncbi:MAG: TonB family protein [Acidobacteria bacterium]|nr:TonB family protein [Acidobacteriota bacterium]MBS1864304.1 TonB family protein [Acidobacteriota bacterium]